MRENLQEKKMEQNNNNGGVCRYSCNRSENNDESYFPPGYRFDPSDQVLVVRYLKKKIMNEQLPFNEIMQSKFFEIDIYHNLKNPEILAVSEKYKLPDGVSEWFIFTPRVRRDPNGSRPNRTAGDGYWKASVGDKAVVKIDDKLKGFKKSLVFFKKGKTPNSRDQKTDWLMNEYTIPGLVPKKRKKMGSANDKMILDECVLCKVYKKKMAITKDNEEPATDSVSSVPEVAEDVVSCVQEVAQDGEQLCDFNAYKKQCTEQHNRGLVFADQNPTIEQQQSHINTTCMEQQPQPLSNAYKKQCTRQQNRALGFADQNPTIEQQQLHVNTACIEQQPQPLFVDAYKQQCTEQHNRAMAFADQNPTIEHEQLHINAACMEQQPQPLFVDAYKQQRNRALAFAENPTIEQQQLHINTTCIERQPQPLFNAYKKQCTEQQPQDKQYSEQQRQEIFAQIYIGFEACLNQSLEEQQQQPGGGIPYQSAVVVADNEVYVDIDCLTFDQVIEQQQPPLINNTVSHNTDDQYNDGINQALRFYEL